MAKRKDGTMILRRIFKQMRITYNVEIDIDQDDHSRYIVIGGLTPVWHIRKAPKGGYYLIKMKWGGKDASSRGFKEIKFALTEQFSKCAQIIVSEYVKEMFAEYKDDPETTRFGPSKIKNFSFSRSGGKI